ncbi:T9SS type A sorting domain-containing protein [Ferruginibacter albus]|uniref:T9SS type A sorting domain-containing protein n=1 Tax=Ferruginibacter albus TaxID=2875540 RepID=UPI001CC411BC|nr:T9SS type A sorting domain-containing protein [Ferruginibacter albus]UAY52494.1 T9SS type A sorting domain-containing protein [Ferruginibacter albus]
MKNLLNHVSLLLLTALLMSFSGFCTPKLNSYPAAQPTIYLDFDGYYVNSPVWNGGVPFQADAAGMTDAQITEVFNRVAEDYRPFNINITTDEAVFNAAPATQKIRVVVTPTSAWYPGVGGVTYVGSFTWGDETPSFVFCNLLGPNNPKMVAECCSHESGHSLGLYHQSKWDDNCNLEAVYNEGDGAGVESWAPIMGNSYYRNMTGWYNGLTPYACYLSQDNLSVITSQNGFTYRNDDYTDDINATPTTINMAGDNINGVITTPTDKDVFKFTMTKTSSVHLSISPYSVGANADGADLNVKADLYDGSKNLIASYNPSAKMEVTIDTSLQAGPYYIAVSGSGNDNTTNYGSLGSYTLSSMSTVLPIQGITLKGDIQNNQHDLQWNIITTSAIKSVAVEYSTDGKSFSGLSVIAPSDNAYSYAPFQKQDLYYRVKAVSVEGQVMYSNIISLKQAGGSSLFTVSTLVRNSVLVNASENFVYELHNINGTLIVKGSGIQGSNKLNIENQPSGVYVLQLVGSKTKQIERIIKQ